MSLPPFLVVFFLVERYNEIHGFMQALAKKGCGNMFSFSMPELVLILVIALVVFGPGKLPDVGKALGRSLQEFRKATTVAGEETKPEESKTIDVKAVDKEQQAPEKK